MNSTAQLTLSPAKWFVAFYCLFLVGAANFACETSADRPPMEITIFHTNDIHGKYAETAATWKEGNPPIGGFANLSAFVDEERQEGGRVMLLDAGDLMTGNPICNYDYQGIPGGAMMEFMNRMGYDAMALGNHEFDQGLDNLYALLKQAEFPVLSANTYRPSGELTAPERSHVFEIKGLRVGVIGLMTENLYGVGSPKKLAGTKVTSAVAAANERVAEMDPHTDLIILLTHVGVEADRELARQVSGIDLIIGGHSHTRLTEPIIENGVAIVQTGGHNRSFGRVDLTVQGDSIASLEAKLVEQWPRQGGKQSIVSLANEYSERIVQDYGQVIGRLATPWQRDSKGESNIGSWIADRMREFGPGDFAVINSGGIRKNVGTGPVTRLDVLEILPFANSIALFECSGTELLKMIQLNAEAAVSGSKGILQISGIRYSYRVRSGQVEVTDVSINGKQIDPRTTYRGVGVDFIVFGNAKRYLGFEPAERQIEGTLIADVIIKAIESTKTAIDTRLDGRIELLPPAAAVGGNDRASR